VEVPLSVADGMSKDCAVNLDVINTVPKAVLLNRVTVLSATKMAALDAAIRFALELR
jgi:mRNA-degrading endonuclease toxin of MazEF toxin-antitoxin module